jgi:WhiB family transcriptional regulator, redox-sensing transcriptional regulator
MTESWTERAACRNHSDPDAWFSEDLEARAVAWSLCRRCPVRAECAAAGVGERWGTWGGCWRTPSTYERGRVRAA